MQIVLMVALNIAQCIVAAAKRDDAAGANATRGGCGASPTAVHHTRHSRNAAARCLWRGRNYGQLSIRLPTSHIQPGHALWLTTIEGGCRRDATRAANVDTGARVAGITAQPLLAVGARQGGHAAGYVFVDGRGRGLHTSRQTAELLSEGRFAAATLEIVIAAHRSDLKKAEERSKTEEQM